MSQVPGEGTGPTDLEQGLQPQTGYEGLGSGPRELRGACVRFWTFTSEPSWRGKTLRWHRGESPPPPRTTPEEPRRSEKNTKDERRTREGKRREDFKVGVR